MNPAETLALTRFVKAACPQQKFDEFTADAWHELLADVAFGDARTAVRDLAKRQPFVSPAEIRAEVRKIRAERFREVGNLEPDYDKDDVAGGIEAIRRYRRAVGDGDVSARPRPLPGKPCPDDVVKMLEGVIERMPRMPSTRPQPNPRSWPAAQAERAAQAASHATLDRATGTP